MDLPSRREETSRGRRIVRKEFSPRIGTDFFAGRCNSGIIPAAEQLPSCQRNSTACTNVHAHRDLGVEALERKERQRYGEEKRGSDGGIASSLAMLVCSPPVRRVSRSREPPAIASVDHGLHDSVAKASRFSVPRNAADFSVGATGP